MRSEASLNATDVDLLQQTLRDAEKRIALLTDVIEALSQSRDAVSLLQRSVEAVVRATAASGAFVYLWNEELDRFVLRVATEGHQKAFVGQVSLRPGEGLTGWSALMRRPVLLGRDLGKDPRVVLFPELMEEDFLSCLIVPILIPGGKTVGVFSIYAGVEDAFSESDLRLVDEVAHLLASGIDRAHVVDMWERQSAALESLIGLTDMASQDVVGVLTDLVQRVSAIVPSDISIVESLNFDGSPSDSAAVVARRPQADPAVEDTHGQVAMTSITARQMAKSANPPLQSASIPMRLADRTLGVLTVYRVAPFSNTDRALLEAVAGYGALAIQAVAGCAQGESALSQLMSVTTAEAGAALLERYGWTPGTWITPVIIRCDPELVLASGRSLDSIVHTVEVVFSGKWRRVLPSTSGVVAALVFTSQTPGRDDDVSSWVVHEIAAALEDKGQSVGVTIGVGAPSADVLEIASEFQKASSAVNWAAVSGEGVRLETSDESNVVREIVNVGRTLAPEVNDQIARVTRVQEYDSRNGTELLRTLEVFVRERGSAQQASNELFIHRNTLRQRLNKISSLIGQPVEDMEDWLPVLLAILMLHRT